MGKILNVSVKKAKVICVEEKDKAQYQTTDFKLLFHAVTIISVCMQRIKVFPI